MKRITALLTAVALLCTMAACTKDTDTPNAPTESVDAAMLSHSCKSTPLTDDPDFSNPLLINAGDKLLLQGFHENITIIGLFDPETDSIQKTELNNLTIIGAEFAEEQLTIFVSGYDSETGTYIEQLLTYDTNMQLADTKDITAVWGNQAYFYDWCRLSDGTEFAVSTEGIFVRLPDSEPQSIPGNGELAKLIVSPNEEVYVIPNNGTPSRIDRNTLTLATLSMEGLPKENNNNGHYYDGCGEYDLLCTDEESLYGIRTDSGTMEELVNFGESFFVEGAQCAALPDGRYALTDFDYHSLTASAWLLTPRTQEETNNTQLVSIASFNFSQGFESLIARFNRQAEGCRIVMKDYYDETNYEKGVEAFYADLLGGIVPDMMLIEDDYQMLSNKGMFEDLRPWMEQDPDFHEEDYMMNFLEVMSYKGRLERVAFQFGATCYMAKTQFLGGNTALRAKDVLSLELPEGMQYLYHKGGRTEIFMSISNGMLGSFVDDENGTCSFDSEDFVALLELVNTVPKGSMPEEEDCYREDRVLLDRLPLLDLNSYHAEKEVVFGSADVAMVGLTCDEGNGGILNPIEAIAISAQSQKKEACWEFIKFCLREENQFTDGSLSGFPLNRNALQASLACQIEPPEKDSYSEYAMNGESIKISTPTQQDADEVMAYLEGITACSFSDRKITAIVEEEAGKFFAGDCSAENAADAIQSRVILYLSEQR